jgi:hypothetical protein
MIYSYRGGGEEFGPGSHVDICTAIAKKTTKKFQQSIKNYLHGS